MKTQPLVSVIMNCYNGDKYLKEAIDSVYAQTYQNWEIIFWDNASTDNSPQIAQSYDSRLKYYRANQTTFLGEARVLAVNEAQGEYLAFLDCDDVWYPDKLEKQIELFLENPELGIVYGDAEIIYESDNRLVRTFSNGEHFPEGDVFYQLVKYNFIPFVSTIISRNKYYECGGFSTELKNSTDYHLFLKLAYKYKVAALQTLCCKYREHGNNLSKKQYVINVIEGIDAIKSFPNDDIMLQFIKFRYVELALAYFKEKNITNAIHVIVENKIFVRVLKRLVEFVIKVTIYHVKEKLIFAKKN